MFSTPLTAIGNEPSAVILGRRAGQNLVHLFHKTVAIVNSLSALPNGFGRTAIQQTQRIHRELHTADACVE